MHNIILQHEYDQNCYTNFISTKFYKWEISCLIRLTNYIKKVLKYTFYKCCTSTHL